MGLCNMAIAMWGVDMATGYANLTGFAIGQQWMSQACGKVVLLLPAVLRPLWPLAGPDFSSGGERHRAASSLSSPDQWLPLLPLRANRLCRRRPAIPYWLALIS